jgi:hypothetical protein
MLDSSITGECRQQGYSSVDAGDDRQISAPQWFLSVAVGWRRQDLGSAITNKIRRSGKRKS